MRVLLCLPFALILSACQPTVPAPTVQADGFQCPTPPQTDSFGMLTDPQALAWQSYSQQELLRLPAYWEKLIAHGSDSTLDNVVHFTAPGQTFAGLAPLGWRERAVVAKRLRVTHHCAGIIAVSPL